VNWKMAAPSLAAVAASAGCVYEYDTVSVFAYLFTAPVLDAESTVLSGAAVDGYDLAGELISEGYEPYGDRPGYYRVPELPIDSEVVLVVREAGFWVPTVHSGRIRDSALYLDNGELFIYPLEDVRTYLEAWRRAAPEGAQQTLDLEVDGDGGFVLGLLAEPEAWAGTRVAVEDAGGVLHDASYFAETGLPDKSLAATTADGRFAVFGLPVGPMKAWLTLPGRSEPLSEAFESLVVEDGITSLYGFRIVEE